MIMKLSLSVALTSIGLTQAVLGPGYEDYLHCPPGNCEIYINPFGYTGPVSMYNKCFDTTTSTFTNGIWTGDLTNVTAPEGYVQDPPKCTAEQYSQCDTAAECSLQIGPGCSCFVTSTIFPFDVSGYIEDEDSCTGKECDGHAAECSAGADGEGNTCMIKFDVDVMPTPPVTTNATTGATVTGATTLPPNGGGGGSDVTVVTVPATLPSVGDDGDGIVKETNTTTNSTDVSDEDEAVPTAAPSSGNVARVSISLLVVSAVVFGCLF